MTQFINTQRGSKGEPGERGLPGASINSASFDGNDIVYGLTDGSSVRLVDGKTELTGPQGEPGQPGQDGAAATISVGTTTTGNPGTNASVTNSGTSSAAVFNFTIPRGADGQNGQDGKDGADGQDGAAATITAGTATGLPAGSSPTVTNSGSSSAAVFNFGIPKGDTGETGNGISSVTTSKSGKITTVTMEFTNGSSPFSFTVSDGQDGQGAGDVIGPDSSVDGDIVVFDGTSGKLIKDGNKKISDLQDKIQNLDTIISNAQAGKNASDTIGNYGDIVTHDADEFATSTQGGKADTALQPNDNISELNNNAGYQTQSQVNSAISTAIATKQDALSNMSTAEGQGGIAENQRTMTAKNLKEIIQYYTSTFITNSVSDLTNYYLKSETYTKAEVASLIGSIQQFHYEIFANLSDITSPAGNVLYLIGPKGSGSDLYEEYVYTTQFIKIGETSIDLSNYVTISALNTALSSYVTSAVFTQTLQDYVTTTNLSQTLADYVTSSGLTTILANYVTTTSLNSILEDYATTSAMATALAGKIDYPSGGTVGQALKKTANGSEWGDISGLPAGGQNGQIIMMVNGTPTWVTPTAKGFKMLSPDSPLTVPYDWYGTEAEYSSATKSDDTEYRTV